MLYQLSYTPSATDAAAAMLPGSRPGARGNGEGRERGYSIFKPVFSLTSPISIVVVTAPILTAMALAMVIPWTS